MNQATADAKIDRRTLVLSVLGGGAGLTAISHLCPPLFERLFASARKGDRDLIGPQSRVDRFMKATQNSDVVVFSPRGRISIALRYTKDMMDAPLIVDKVDGADAAKMLYAGFLNETPMYQDDRLAMCSLRRLHVGQQIPRKAYKPVARVLAAVYRAREKGTAPFVYFMG